MSDESLLKKRALKANGKQLLGDNDSKKLLTDFINIKGEEGITAKKIVTRYEFAKSIINETNTIEDKNTRIKFDKLFKTRGLDAAIKEGSTKIFFEKLMQKAVNDLEEDLIYEEFRNMLKN